MQSLHKKIAIAILIGLGATNAQAFDLDFSPLVYGPAMVFGGAMALWNFGSAYFSHSAAAKDQQHKLDFERVEHQVESLEGESQQKTFEGLAQQVGHYEKARKSLESDRVYVPFKQSFSQLKETYQVASAEKVELDTKHVPVAVTRALHVDYMKKHAKNFKAAMDERRAQKITSRNWSIGFGCLGTAFAAVSAYLWKS